MQTHPAERKTEPGAAGDDQVQMVATVVEQERQCRPRVVVARAVPVVDNEGDVLVGRVKLVDQRGEHVPLATGALDFEFVQQFPTEGWLWDGNGLDQVGEEPDKRVVVIVDRQPVRAVRTGPICSSPRRNDTNTAGRLAA